MVDYFVFIHSIILQMISIIYSDGVSSGVMTLG